MLNKATLIGNIVKKPDITETKTGTKIANYTVACNYYYMKEQATEFHKVTTFGNVCDAIADLEPGSKVYVEGIIRTEQYEKDGQKKEVRKIVSDKVLFLGKARKKEEKEDGKLEKSREDKIVDEIDLMDIPF